MAEDKLLEEIKARLTLLVRVQLDPGFTEKDPKDKIYAMREMGFSNIAIAEFLGVTPNAVKIAFHRIKKNKKKAKTTHADAQSDQPSESEEVTG